VVIPAAGRGSRLGLDVPKILVPIFPDLTVWDVLRASSLAVADHVHVVVSPHGQAAFASAAKADIDAGRVSHSLQPEPLGMGDAVFRAEPVFSTFDAMIVMWGDQVGVSAATLARVRAALLAATGDVVALPLATTRAPYVHYEIDDAGRLTNVLQSREGDVMPDVGEADVGVFGLAWGKSRGLREHWAAYAARGIVGKKTREANFLPFMPFLAQERGFAVTTLRGIGPEEARGINTKEDLEHFQKTLLQANKKEGAGT